MSKKRRPEDSLRNKEISINQIRGSLDIANIPDDILTREELDEFIRDNTFFPEHVLAGLNVSVTNNGDGTITIASSQLTDEQVQDIVGNLIIGGSGINVAYDDVANTLTIASTGSSVSSLSKIWFYS